MAFQELLNDFSVQFIRPHVMSLCETNKYFIKNLNTSNQIWHLVNNI